VTEEDFEQPRRLWKLFKDKGEDKEFLHNLSGHVGKALPEVQKGTIGKSRVSRYVVWLSCMIDNNDLQQKCGGESTRRSHSVWQMRFRKIIRKPTTIRRHRRRSL
jgi:hypothetical protein